MLSNTLGASIPKANFFNHISHAGKKMKKKE
jgi:hypothetical protein